MEKYSKRNNKWGNIYIYYICKNVLAFLSREESFQFVERKKSQTPDRKLGGEGQLMNAQNSARGQFTQRACSLAGRKRRILRPPRAAQSLCGWLSLSAMGSDMGPARI